MAKKSRITLFAALLVGVVLGGVIGARSQSSNAGIDQLASERASLSKMDVLLMNARIDALQSILLGDLSVPLVPQTYRYDDKQHKIEIRVFVNPSWLSKKNVEALKSDLNDAVASACNSTLTGTTETLLTLGMVGWKQYCTVKFFTVSPETRPAPKDVAIYENGQLTLK